MIYQSVTYKKQVGFSVTMHGYMVLVLTSSYCLSFIGSDIQRTAIGGQTMLDA